MKVESLDHVNIIAADLDATARFYVEVFGLQRRDAPPPLTETQAQWMFDETGRAIFHINSVECPRTYEREVHPGPTGSIHHVALRCSGYEDITGRLRDRQLTFQVNNIAAIGLRQVFVMDPNGVLLELNFSAS